jgi:hypothetical protein
MLSKDVFDEATFNKVNFEQITIKHLRKDPKQPKILIKIQTCLWMLKTSRIYQPTKIFVKCL